MAPSICTNHVVTTPQSEYVCPISNDNSNLEPPIFKRQKMWVLNIAKEWDDDDMVDIYDFEVGPRQVSSFILKTMHSLFDTAYVQYQSVSDFTTITYTLNVSVNSKNNVICAHGLNMKCLSCEDRNKIWTIDSDASMHFTPDQSDFVIYQPLGDHKIPVSTAAGVIHVVGKGSIWIRWKDPQGVDQILSLHDIGHLPNSGVKLISMGALLNRSTKVIGNAEAIKITYGDGTILAWFTPGPLGPNIYVLQQLPFNKSTLKTMTSHSIDHDIMHKRLGHLSNDVLRHACKHMHNFPLEVSAPKENIMVLAALKAKCLIAPFHLMSEELLNLLSWFTLIWNPIPRNHTIGISMSLHFWMTTHSMCGLCHCALKMLHLQQPNILLPWFKCNTNPKSRDGCPMQEENTNQKLLIRYS